MKSIERNKDQKYEKNKRRKIIIIILKVISFYFYDQNVVGRTTEKKHHHHHQHQRFISFYYFLLFLAAADAIAVITVDGIDVDFDTAFAAVGSTSDVADVILLVIFTNIIIILS